MFSNKNLIISVLAVVLLLLLGTAGYFYWQYTQAQDRLNNPEKVDREETQQIIDKVSQFMNLPKSNLDEGEPTLATVLDKDKLKDQEFFKNAENGDKLLIYAKAQKAYLYRPSTNKIVNVAPVNLGQSLPSVTLRNGTSSDSDAEQVKTQIATLGNVSTVEDAARSTYTKTVVVDVSGKNKDQAEQIAKELGVTVSSQVPSGESKPNTDILVIVGSDQ